MAAIFTLNLPDRALAPPHGGSESRAATIYTLILGGPILLWPALYNGFPLIFSDTGTYISQVLEGHLGWDRPPFYSLFLYFTGWGRSPWPPVILQALCTVWLISRTRMLLWPLVSRQAGTFADLGIIALLSATSLPWAVSELMPDLFTPLLVLGLFLLIFDGALTRAPRLCLCLGLAAIMTFHLTNLPLYAGMCLFILPAAWLAGQRFPWRHIITAPLLAMVALMAMNLIGLGRASISPYGATFYLARLLANGPARLTLAADCPRKAWAQTWRLCRYQSSLPASADAFLWRADSPLYRAGGPKALIVQTRQIIARTLIEHPRAVTRDAVTDTLRQLATFKTGDGLRPWRHTAGATIRRDFPAQTVEAFDHSRQARGRPVLPVWLRGLNTILEALGSAVAILVIVTARLRRWDQPLALPWLAVMALLALLGNALLTGSLSGPHDRYQSRVMWLPVLVMVLAIPEGRFKKKIRIN
jgi:hypothetical protein